MDWIKTPLDITNRIFQSRHPGDWKEEIFDFFNAKLMDDEVLQKIPSLNDVQLHCLQNNSLVRFRCMIQDMFDPEFYLDVYEVKDLESNTKELACGMFCDVLSDDNKIEVNLDSAKNKALDRQVYYCISTPVENAWVKEAYAKQNCWSQFTGDASCSDSKQKRPLDDGDGECPAEQAATSSAMETNNSLLSVDANSTDPDSSPKRARTTKDWSTAGTPGTEMVDLNVPVPDPNAVACIVKIYGKSDAYSLNDVVEFIGILSMDPSMANFSEDTQNLRKLTSEMKLVDSMDFEEEAVAHSPPSSLVPRLHVIKGFRLKHNNPYQARDIMTEAKKNEVHELVSECLEIRNHLHSVLQQMLWGDSLAADYIICHLISSVYVRKDVTALGKFSVNLTNINKVEDFPKIFYELISLLTTKSYYLPLTISKLNEGTFTPCKDYSTNRVKSGLLQLSSQTHLVVDETVLTPGQLDSKGVKNVAALGNLITWQKVEYDFGFHHLEFSADVPVLIISERKSLLPADFVVPVETRCLPSTAQIFSAVQEYLTPVLLRKIRCYLSVLKMLEYSMSDDLQKVVQDDFVEQRQVDVKSMKIDDLHNLLTIARLLSLSFGQTTLVESTWEKAKQMELERKTRLN